MFLGVVGGFPSPVGGRTANPLCLTGTRGFESHPSRLNNRAVEVVYTGCRELAEEEGSIELRFPYYTALLLTGLLTCIGYFEGGVSGAFAGALLGFLATLFLPVSFIPVVGTPIYLALLGLWLIPSIQGLVNLSLSTTTLVTLIGFGILSTVLCAIATLVLILFLF